MKTYLLIAGLTAAAFVAPAANALTITNADNAAYTVKVTPTSGKATDMPLKAKAKADVDCAKGCTLNLNGKTQAVDGKVKAIWIKSAKFSMN